MAYQEANFKSQEECDRYFTALVQDRGFPTKRIQQHRRQLKENYRGTSKAKKQATKIAIQYLDENYSRYIRVLQGVSCETFEQTDLECVQRIVDHQIEVFQELSKDPKWIQNGFLYHHDVILLGMGQCLFRCPIFIQQHCINDTRLLQSYAMISAARASPKLLQQLWLDDSQKDDVAQTVMGCVNNALNGIKIHGGVENKRLFKLLVSTNLLPEVVRWFSYFGNAKFSWILDYLMDVPKLIQKHFAKGTKAGTTLQNILDGKNVDMNLIHPNILQKFRSIRTIALNQFCHNDKNEIVDRLCVYCNASESLNKNLLICSRCKSAWYCNQKCQRAHWSVHKRHCKAKAKDDTKHNDRYDRLLTGVLTNNVFYILAAFVEAMRQKNQPKKNLMLIVDFYGSAPALQKPPQFQVECIDKCLQQKNTDQDAKFDFFGCTKTELKSNLKTLEEINNQYQPRLSDRMVVCVRNPNGTSFMAVHNIKGPKDDEAAYYSSDEVVDAFAEAYFDLEFTRLQTLIDEKDAEIYRAMILNHTFTSLSQEQMEKLSRYHFSSVGDDRTKQLYKVGTESKYLKVNIPRSG